jgi:hypothetical protein
MTPFKSLRIVAGIFAIAVTGALAFESVYRISVAPRQAEPFVPVQSGSDPAPARSQR